MTEHEIVKYTEWVCNFVFWVVNLAFGNWTINSCYIYNNLMITGHLYCTREFINSLDRSQHTCLMVLEMVRAFWQTGLFATLYSHCKSHLNELRYQTSVWATYIWNYSLLALLVWHLMTRLMLWQVYLPHRSTTSLVFVNLSLCNSSTHCCFTSKAYGLRWDQLLIIRAWNQRSSHHGLFLALTY